MRISDWSSDVCSSDLPRPAPGLPHRRRHPGAAGGGSHRHRPGARLPEVSPGTPPATVPPPPVEQVDADVARALIEDIGSGDVTASLLPDGDDVAYLLRSEEHTSELQSLMRNSFAVFCL